MADMNYPGIWGQNPPIADRGGDFVQPEVDINGQKFFRLGALNAGVWPKGSPEEIKADISRVSSLGLTPTYDQQYGWVIPKSQATYSNPPFAKAYPFQKNDSKFDLGPFALAGGALAVGPLAGVLGATGGAFEGATAAGEVGTSAGLTGADAFAGAKAAGVMDMWDALAPAATSAGATVAGGSPWAGGAAAGELAASSLAANPFEGALAEGAASGGDSLLNDVINWAKNNQLLSSTATNVAGGFVRGAMQPSLDRARIERETEAMLKLIEQKRKYGQLRAPINIGSQPSGVMLRQSSAPGIINGGMR